MPGFRQGGHDLLASAIGDFVIREDAVAVFGALPELPVRRLDPPDSKAEDLADKWQFAGSTEGTVVREGQSQEAIAVVKVGVDQDNRQRGKSLEGSDGGIGDGMISA